MMTYLNGLEESQLSGKRKRKHKLKNLAQHLTNRATQLHKKIIEKNKALAKKIGAGIKRIANIKKNVQFKVFIKAVEKNVGGLAVRLKEMYKIKPTDTKKFLSTIGDWNKIKDAINKGDRHHKLQNIAGLGEGEDSAGGQAGNYAEAAKQSVGIIAKIMEWFKKHKKNKGGDEKLVSDMQNSVDADSTIPKVDENGKELPAVEDPENAEHEQGKEGGVFAGQGKSGNSLFSNPYIIAGGAALALGAVYLMTKKK